MNKLYVLKNMEFKISWKLIAIGLLGNDEIPPSITQLNAVEYIDGLLTDINEQTDDIIRLVCEKDNLTEFDKVLLHFKGEIEIMNRHTVILWVCEILCEIICIGFLIYYFVSGSMFWIPLYIVFTISVLLAKKIQPDLKNNFFTKIPSVLINVYYILFVILILAIENCPHWVAPVTILLCIQWKKCIKKIQSSFINRFLNKKS